MTKTIKIPGPDHPISIERNAKRVVVTLAGKTIADTTDALTLREAAYPAVHYIPRKDVDMAALVRSDTTSYCPTRAKHPISAFRSTANAPSMRSGPTRRLMTRSARSRIISLSIPTALMASKSRRSDARIDISVIDS